MGERTPAQRVERAIEMVRVFQDGHHVPGLTTRTLPDPTPEEVHEVLTLVLVELIAGARPTPASHGPGCWARPGHHQCAIDALKARTS